MGNYGVIDRVRRNHAIEHATIAVLAARGHRSPMGGYSTPGGFWVYGDIPSDGVAEAAEHALELLRAEESRLAVSPYCGTNLAVGIAGAVLLAGLVRSRVSSRAARVPLVAAAVLGAVMLKRPLGMAAQREITTLSEVGDAEVKGVRRMGFGRHVLHRVEVGRCRWGRSRV
jgi:hypothetical protein